MPKYFPHFTTAVCTSALNDRLHFEKISLLSWNNPSHADAGIFQLGQGNDCLCSSSSLYRSCFHNCPKYVISYYVISVQLDWFNWKVCIIKLWCFDISLGLTADLSRQHRRIPHCILLALRQCFRKRVALFPVSFSQWQPLTMHTHYATSVMQ